MHSLDKIHQLRSQLLGPPSENPDALELGLRTITQLAIPLVTKFLPEDPSELDKFLEDAALRILDIRSDGAPASPQFLHHLFETMATSPENIPRLVGVLGDLVSSAPGLAAAPAQPEPVPAPAPEPPPAPAAAPEAPAPAPENPAPAPDAPAPAPESPPAAAPPPAPPWV